MIDLTNLAKTLWGEARGEGYAGMQAVANVVMNRVKAGKWFSGPVSYVVLKDKQFSVWNEDDPNRALLDQVGEEDALYLQALEIAARAMRGSLPDITSGSTHYHTKQVSPSWANGQTPVADIGNHLFYRGIA